MFQSRKALQIQYITSEFIELHLQPLKHKKVQFKKVTV